MKRISIALMVLSLVFAGCAASKTSSTDAKNKIPMPTSTSLQTTPFYEMRTYYAAPGKLDDLNARFRNNTMRVFAKHNMVNVGYWLPIENTENKLVYLLAYGSSEAREQSWKAFVADPEWQGIAKASEANGKLVSKVESVFLENTDYSPVFKEAKKSGNRVFELRTYHASEGNIENLHDRFRNHTLDLFKKHGMTNIAYFKPVNTNDKDVLIYLLAHDSKAAAEASWNAFRADPVWIEAKNASEAKGGGSLTTKVTSEFLTPTDYSPIK